MGYAMALSPCVGCGRPFAYNPVRVPSLRVDGERKPVCLSCVERANPARIRNGLEPIIPAPDAYEPVDEREL